ncbi:hypothetical protein [Pseudomonas sp. A-R-19]
MTEEVNRSMANIRDVTELLVGQSDRSAEVSPNLNVIATTQQSLMSHFRV